MSLADLTNLTRRTKLPSPEKNSPSSRVVISPAKSDRPSTSLEGSPPKFEAFELTKGTTRQELHAVSSASHPDRLELPPSLNIRNTRHIVFENHPLILDGSGPPLIPSKEHMALIRSLFDGVFEVSISASFMVVRCKKLPSKPWPATISGIPLFMTTSHTDTPATEGKPGRTPPILPSVTISNVSCPSGEDFAMIAKYFAEELGTVVTEIMWNGVALRLKIPVSTKISTLPRQIGGIMALYDTTTAIPKHHEAAKRLIASSPTIRDDTCYTPDLRPGMMLSCGTGGGEEYYTTSGVIVSDLRGEKWLTVATNGFPIGREIVYHPSADYMSVGVVQKVFCATDISLVKLHSNIKYSSQTFGSDLHPPQQIKSLKKPNGLRVGDILSMENPFSGYCEGSVVDAVWMSIPEDEGEEALPWVIITSFYLGNGLEEPLEGSCGSPVLTKDGEVVGFFRFLAENGKGYCVSAEVLIDIGMSLSEIN